MLLNKLLLILIGSTSLLAVAQNNSNNNFKIDANIEAGCIISMDNIVIGDISGIVMDKNIPYGISVKCTKGTIFSIKTPPAQSIVSPTNPNYYFSYIYPMYHTTDPDNEFVGYRFLITDTTYRIGSGHHFGDGTKNNRNIQTSYIQALGTGQLEYYSVDFRYWVYTHLKVGNYQSSQTFTLEY